jgi:hypothetical protein
MRSIPSILARLVVAGMLVFNSAGVVLAQDRTATRREWGTLANGRTEFEVSDPALVPSTLSLAAEQSGCRYQDDIKERPARFIRPEGRRLAILFCSAIGKGSQNLSGRNWFGHFACEASPHLSSRSRDRKLRGRSR